MRIGLTVYGSLEERSGGFRYDRKLIEGLRRAGDTVELIELPWRAYHRGLRDNVSRRLRRRLAVDVDVMLQDELAHPSLCWTNRSLAYPLVTIVHHLRASEPGWLRHLYSLVERQYLRTVDGAICNSATTESVVRSSGVSRTLIAPPAGDRFDPDIDPTRLEDSDGASQLQVTFVGNITARKGLETLIRGVSRAERTIHLTVVGAPVEEQYVDRVRSIVHREGLDAHVRFTGQLPDDKLATHLEQSDVLAVPSRYEGFGIVYLEGMSFGLPALATRAGGASDLVQDGDTGVLVDPGDPAAVARELDRFAEDRQRLGRMSKAARAYYLRHPGWQETTARVRRFLADVAGTTEGVA
jgi:glycosyltransferase involved in cell wall biosynthesis